MKVDSLSCFRANLNVAVTRPIEYRRAVIFSLRGNTIYLVPQSEGLGLQKLTVRFAVSVISRLNRKFTHTLEHIRDIVSGVLDNCQHRQTIVGILCCHVQAADLRGHTLSDRKTCCVICCRINFFTGGKSFHGCLQFIA